MKIVAIILFVAMYVLMIAKPRYRYITALVTALIYIICGILPVSEILPSIDFNVLLMILGTMMIVSYFIDSKMPSLIADKILDLAPNVCWVTILMSLFARSSGSTRCPWSSALRCLPTCRARQRSSAIRHPSCWAPMPAWTSRISSSWTESPACSGWWRQVLPRQFRSCCSCSGRRSSRFPQRKDNR